MHTGNTRITQHSLSTYNTHNITHATGRHIHKAARPQILTARFVAQGSVTWSLSNQLPAVGMQQQPLLNNDKLGQPQLATESSLAVICWLCWQQSL